MILILQSVIGLLREENILKYKGENKMKHLRLIGGISLIIIAYICLFQKPLDNFQAGIVCLIVGLSFIILGEIQQIGKQK
jgi:hypothetical protein